MLHGRRRRVSSPSRVGIGGGRRDDSRDNRGSGGEQWQGGSLMATEPCKEGIGIFWAGTTRAAAAGTMDVPARYVIGEVWRDGKERKRKTREG